MFNLRKTTLSVFLISCTFYCSSANAWFFFFIPGSVTSKIGDILTGSEGDNCVGQQTPVGAVVKLSNGGYARVKSLSGTSSRCPDSNMPIRALLEPIPLGENYSPSNSEIISTPVIAQVTSNAKINFPEGWEQQPLTENLKSRKVFLKAVNKTIDTAILVSTTDRNGITDVRKFLETKSRETDSKFQNVTNTDVVEFKINGLNAWQYQKSGILSNKDFTYLNTFVESSSELIVMSAYTLTPNFPSVKNELDNIINSVSGLQPYENSKPPTTIQPNNVSTSNTSVATKLQELKDLLDKKLITESEYQSKKIEILKSM